MLRTTQFYRKEKSLLWRLAKGSPCPREEWDLDKTFSWSLSWRVTQSHTGSNFDSYRSEPGLSCINSRQSLPCTEYCWDIRQTTKRAKRDAFEFAKKIVEWVQEVQSTFEGVEHNQFGCLTWRSLRKTQDLINEICSCENKRLMPLFCRAQYLGLSHRSTSIRTHCPPSLTCILNISLLLLQQQHATDATHESSLVVALC